MKTTRHSPVALAAVTSAPIAGSTTAHGSVRDVYVDASVSCSGNGSAAAPFCEISSALASASIGEVVRVAPGTYLEKLEITQDVTIVGTHGADVTIIDAAFGTSPRHAVTIESAATVTLEGLAFTGSLNGAVVSIGSLTMRRCVVRDNATVDSGFFPPSASVVRAVQGGPMAIEACEMLTVT